MWLREGVTIKLGLQIPNFSYGTGVAELFPTVIAQAQEAEAAGFDSVFVMDHFYQLPMLGPPDSFMVFSNSGVNEVVMDVAFAAKKKGLPVIAVVSLEHCLASTAVHSSGKRLPDVAAPLAYVIDRTPALPEVEPASHPSREGEQTTVSGVVQRRDRLVQGHLRAAREHHPRTLRDQHVGTRPSESAGSPGDDEHAIHQLEVHHPNLTATGHDDGMQHG